MVSSRVVLLVLPTSSPAATARRTRVSRASPRRRSELRRSRSPSTGFGADSGPRAASRTALPSTSRVSRYSKVSAPVSRGWESEMNALPRSCWSCRTPSGAVPGQDERPHLPAAARAVVNRGLDQRRQRGFLHQVTEHRPQLVGLGDDHRRGRHRQPARVHGLLDRGVDLLLERLRHRHDRPGATGPGRRGVVAHPLRHGHRRRPAGGLTPVHRLADHRHPGRVTGQAEVVDLAEQPGQTVRTAAAGRLPQHRPQRGDRRARRRDLLTALRQAHARPLVPLHDDNSRGDHRQPKARQDIRITLCHNAFQCQSVNTPALGCGQRDPDRALVDNHPGDATGGGANPAYPSRRSGAPLSEVTT